MELINMKKTAMGSIIANYKMNYFIAGLGGLAIILSVFGCNDASTSDKKEELSKLMAEQESLNQKIIALKEEINKDNQTASPQNARKVLVNTLQPTLYRHFIEVQGTVSSDSEVLLSPQTGGIVKSIPVSEGNTVTKGQVLAELDNQIIWQTIEEARNSYNLLLTLYQKQKNLWDQKIGSEIQYLTAKSNKEGMEKRLATLNQQLELTRLRSPINGSVDQILIKTGQMVAPGMPSIRVVNISDLKVKGEVPETYAAAIRKGNKAEIYFPDINQTIFKEVTFAGKVIKPLNRTFDVEVKLDKSSGGLSLNPNMIAVIRINDFSVDSALVVPINLIQSSEEGKYLFVIRSKGSGYVAERKIIQITSSYDGNALITGGISAGDRIVVTGYQALANNQAVQF
jgi:membrane fusion protein, multidrug efflux system